MFSVADSNSLVPTLTESLVRGQVGDLILKSLSVSARHDRCINQSDPSFSLYSAAYVLLATFRKYRFRLSRVLIARRQSSFRRGEVIVTFRFVAYPAWTVLRYQRYQSYEPP